MSKIADIFEPEELVGAFWHRIISDVGSEKHYPEAAVSLENIQRRLEIFFRAIGGYSGVEIKSIPMVSADFRKKLMAVIGHGSTAVTKAKFDGDTLFLPQNIDVFSSKSDNEKIYKWLVAWAAIAGVNQPPVTYDDPLQNDIAFIRYANNLSDKICQQFKGLEKVKDNLASKLLADRQMRKLPEIEDAIEQCVRALIGGAEPKGQAGTIWQAINDDLIDIKTIKAPLNYKSFLPLILWGEISPAKIDKAIDRAEQEHSVNENKDDDDEKTHKAKRQKSDEIVKENSLVLHRFESIFSWSEMMNINRSIDDDEEENAKKAANDSDEIGVVNISKKAATKLKFDLDLSPQDIMHEKISAKYTYDEWDYRKGIYYKDHCKILSATAPTMDEKSEQWQPDKEARKRIRAVKRQFEALRPKRERFMRQIDGDEIDMDALVRSKTDEKANGESSNRIFSNMKTNARDLAIAVLVDVSRSAESYIDGRQVIDISKEALMAFSLGLAASGDDNAIYSFSSLRRDRVNVSTVKDFNEPLDAKIFSRIGALKPGFYTRMGAAIRHTTKQLVNRGNSQRLLLVLTDGKPNDLDHYEGRYGVEDSAKAVREARRMGIAVFGITIDKKARSYFPHIFGQNAFAITNNANDLTLTLPQIYRHLVS